MEATDSLHQATGAAEGPGMNRLLALDGGGVRGFYSLAILRRIEQILRERYREVEPNFRLCHYFNFIGGTSVGAIIAAMLARGMSVDEVEAEFRQNIRKMFTRAPFPTSWFRWQYRSGPLARTLESLFSREDGSPILFGDPEIQSLLMLVTCNASTKSPWPLVNNPGAKYADVSDPCCNLRLPLWKLVRASTAAPIYFEPEPLTVRRHKETKRFIAHEFVDGGVTSLNSPAFRMYLSATVPEHRLEMAQGVDKMLVVSVGTGATKLKAVQGAVRDLHVADAAKHAFETMMDAASQMQDILCRVYGSYANSVPDQIDGELGDLRTPEADIPKKAFRYLRYEGALTDKASDSVNIPLDDVNAAGRLEILGKEYARDHVQEADLPGGPLFGGGREIWVEEEGVGLKLHKLCFLHEGTELPESVQPKLTPVPEPKLPWEWRGVAALAAAGLAGAGWWGVDRVWPEGGIGAVTLAQVQGGLAFATVGLAIAGMIMALGLPRRRAALYPFIVAVLLWVLAGAAELACIKSCWDLAQLVKVLVWLAGQGLWVAAVMAILGRPVIRTFSAKTRRATEVDPNAPHRSRVYLGGTCNGSRWREILKPKLEELRIGYYDPVVPDWNEAAARRERWERERCDYCLYVFTPKMIGFYGAVEAAMDSMTRPHRVLLCLLEEDEGLHWSEHDRKAFRNTFQQLEARGATVLPDLDGVVKWLEGKP